MLSRPQFQLLAGVALLLVLSATFLSTEPPPEVAAPEASESRELDEAAEEVRAVATGMRRLEQRIAAQEEQNRRMQESVARLGRRLEQWAQPQPATPPAKPPEPAAPEPAPEFDMESLVHTPPAAHEPEPELRPASPDTALTWIEPVGSGGVQLDVPQMALDSLPGGKAETGAGRPRFVIPPSILSGVSLTALVGRIPRGGAVQDPWPFVAVSLADNVTANGVRLPRLRGILWRGVAQGDAVLSCARATVRSMVYVFDDGVFHAAQAPEQGGFGYLADKAGNPCLHGEVRTTAPDNMRAHLLASIVAGAGGAFAEDQVQRSTSAGTETASVQGDAFKFLLGQTVHGAAATYGDYLQRYANDTWDAVLVPAGRDVDIHITAAIPVLHSPQQTIHDASLAPVALLGGGLD